jgi:hypothetical protein
MAKSNSPRRKFGAVMAEPVGSRDLFFMAAATGRSVSRLRYNSFRVDGPSPMFPEHRISARFSLPVQRWAE